MSLEGSPGVDECLATLIAEHDGAFSDDEMEPALLADGCHAPGRAEVQAAERVVRQHLGGDTAKPSSDAMADLIDKIGEEIEVEHPELFGLDADCADSAVMQAAFEVGVGEAIAPAHAEGPAPVPDADELHTARLHAILAQWTASLQAIAAAFDFACTKHRLPKTHPLQTIMSEWNRRSVANRASTGQQRAPTGHRLAM